MDVREIAAKLGVATILEGSVRKAGNKVRVTAQLIDARNGVHLWSETYNRDLNDIFAVQGDIAGAVVQALKIELLGQVPLATTLNPSSEAHALYLQARYLVHRRTEENAAKAVTLLQPALELESNYAPAWALLAEVHLDQGKYGYAPMASSIADAHKAARRAIELDPKLTQPRLVLIELALSEWDVATANAEMERVLALDPGNADALRIAGNLATTRGDTKTGIALLRQSLARDPLRFPTYNGLGLSQLYAGQLVEAEATFRERLELDPDGASSYSSYAFVLLTKGDPQAALEMAKREPDEALRLTAAALSLHALDRSTESDVLLNQLITGHAEEMAYQISEVYAYRGEVDNAFTWLGRAYDQQDGGLQEILGDPTLANLRNDPRYTALVRKLNLGD